MEDRKWNNARIKRELPLHLMMLPAVILLLIFSYGPMVGIVMAFQKYNVTRGILHSPWVGLDNYRFIIQIPGIFNVLWNTLYIAVMKIIAGLIVPVTIALLLNEIGQRLTKRSIQTVLYLPHFLSWVILAGILIDVLSPSSGIINKIIVLLGFKPVFFLGNATLFPYVMVITGVWKEAGFSTIIYLAALTNVDNTLYEASIIDGANRWKQTWHITLPGIKPIIVLMTVLSLGGVLNAGFDQIFNLYSPLVYRTGDVLDTFVFRMGMIDAQYSMATAIGLFNSLVSALLILTSYKLADKLANYRIF